MNARPFRFLVQFKTQLQMALAAVVLLGSVAGAAAATQYVSTEDRSRFREEPYAKAEPGMLSPAEYIALAEKAVHTRYPKVALSRMYSDGVVSHRFYKNAPSADQDIICVQFVYRTPLGGGGKIRPKNYISQKPDLPIPVLQALIRKDRSKIYVNAIRYKPQ